MSFKKWKNLKNLITAVLLCCLFKSYCCICAEGKEIVLCGQTGCGRSFCLDCVDLLVGPGESQKVCLLSKEIDFIIKLIPY